MNSKLLTASRTFVLDERTEKRLNAIAEIRGVSRSTISRDAVAYFVDNWREIYHDREHKSETTAVLEGLL